MASAKIGALNVSLGIDTAQFSAGLKKAQTGLGNFGKAATVGLIGVATAAAAVGAAMGVAVKGAIDHADALAKSAQKAGTTVEALSRLEYAAKLSDVSLESLTGGLQKLGKSMADAVATPTSTAATAFKALGIALKNNDGTLRNSDQVLADVAERFARLEDGSTKTALAMQMFGKSGAELIPLLNSGRDGLKAMADESDRLGATISTTTAKAAEKFNDTLTKIQTTMQGVVNKVMEAALPALQSLADALASPEFAAAAQAAASHLIGAMTEVIRWISAAQQRWDDFSNYLRHGQIKLFPETSKNIDNRAEPGWMGNRTLEGATGQLLINTTFGLVGDSRTYGSPAEMFAALAPPKITLPDGGASAAAAAALKAVNDQIDVMNNGLELQAQSWEEMQAPIRAAADAMGNVFGNMVDNLLSGQDAVKGLIGDFKNLGAQLIKMALNQMIQNLLGSLFGMPSVGVGQGLTGAAVYGGGGTYGIPGYVPSYDGGGFTGYGSRSGGMDGKGGFPAILHPNESVVDHTKGQGGGDSRVLIELGPGLVGSILKQAGEQSVQIVDSRSPLAVAKYQRNRMGG